MLTNTVKKLTPSLILVTLLIILVGQNTSIAQAQSQSQDQGSYCISCHENQYYLYDAGRWYCITQARDRCVNCHGGNNESLDKQEAHTGLIGNPLDHGTGRCETCHIQNAEELADEVFTYTGTHNAKIIVHYAEYEPVSSSFPVEYQSSREKQGEKWFIPSAIAAAILFFAFLYIPK